MPTWTDYQRWLGDTWHEASAPSAPEPELARFSTDTRTIAAGDWFVPLTGPSFDGHRFIKDALAKGAAGYFYESARKPDLDPSLLARGVAVRDALEAFQKAASGWRSSLSGLTIVAMTGSTGKTTTKEMVGAILRQAGKTLATQSSFNNEIGVPKTLAMLEPTHKFAAVEMGARHRGNIRFLCELVRPDVAALLNVGKAHLGEFGSIEALLATKLEIFRDSPAGATLVASFDDERILSGARATKKRVTTFGRGEGADCRVTGETWHEDGTMTVALATPQGPVTTRLGLAHEAFAINAAAAAAMALAAGCSAAEVEAGLRGFTGVKGRFQVHAKEGLTVIDDTYNANPDSMRAGLTTLAKAYGSRGKVVVLGDMLELGDTSPEEHRRVGALCAQVAKPALLIAVGEQASFILEGATKEGHPSAKAHAFPNVDALIAAGLPLRDFGDVVYAKGSNGIKLSRFIESLTGAKA